LDELSTVKATSLPSADIATRPTATEPRSLL
jgi:hypothetical protein